MGQGGVGADTQAVGWCGENGDCASHWERVRAAALDVEGWLHGNSQPEASICFVPGTIVSTRLGGGVGKSFLVRLYFHKYLASCAHTVGNVHPVTKSKAAQRQPVNAKSNPWAHSIY